jgi:hypothetical protein
VRVDTDWGVTLSGEVDANLYDYQAPNPFFGVAQHDTLASGYVAIAAPRLAVLNLVPRIMLNYSNNLSNIAVYRYERASAEFSFVRRY